MIEIKDTISLIGVMERIEPASTFLLDAFFKQKDPIVASNKLMVEYRETKRRLAPFIVRGGVGVNVKREGSRMQIYSPPMVAPRRTVNVEDIEQRGFGEAIYSTMTPAQRAAQIQARDLVELQNMVINRKAKMAADILLKGKCEIKGLADDGETELVDEIRYEGWTQQLTPSVIWSNQNATIYSDIKKCSEEIQSKTGTIPTIMICGRKVEEYLLKNKEIKDWLMIPNRENLAMMNLQPQFISPNVRRIGYLSSLNLEIYAYYETYIDDDGEVKSYIGENDVIIGCRDLGRQVHGAVTLVNEEETGYATYLAEYVPQYVGSKKNQTISLTLYSRFMLVPNWIESWYAIRSCG